MRAWFWPVLITWLLISFVPQLSATSLLGAFRGGGGRRSGGTG